MIEKSRFDALVLDLEQANKVIAKLQFQLDQFIRAVHGTKSEKLRLLTSSPSASSLELPFGEELKEEVEPETKSITVTRTLRKKENPPSRNELPEYLDRVITTLEPKSIPDGAVKIGELVIPM